MIQALDGKVGIQRVNGLHSLSVEIALQGQLCVRNLSKGFEGAITNC